MSNFSIYFKASVASDINHHFHLKGEIKEHFLSQVGRLFRWHVTALPKEVLEIFKRPRVVVVALTVLTMLAVQFAFYPVSTAIAFHAAFKWACTWITLNHIHFALYLSSMSYVLGTGLLAFGRLSQEQVLAQIQKRIAASKTQVQVA